ncbi:hypothetical protein FF2_009668 [Malus domestica]
MVVTSVTSLDALVLEIGITSLEPQNLQKSRRETSPKSATFELGCPDVQNFQTNVPELRGNFLELTMSLDCPENGTFEFVGHSRTQRC